VRPLELLEDRRDAIGSLVEPAPQVGLVFGQDFLAMISVSSSTLSASMRPAENCWIRALMRSENLS
jgi:hypothetical protein